MAQPISICVAKEEMAKKLVQEIAQRGDEIPDKFIQKDGFPEAVEGPAELWNDTLLIDFSLLSSSPHELAKLRTALSFWGCFLVTNHGMETSLLEEVIEVTRQFFALPLEEKLKCSSSESVYQGYGHDNNYGGNQAHPWNDRLFIAVYPEETRQLHLWPQKPEKFCGIVDEYSKKVSKLVEGIFKAMARSLDIGEDRILMCHGKQGPITGRFSIYPRCPSPEYVLGLRPHTDRSTLTVLLPQPEVEGLQVLKDGQWFKVRHLPGTLFVNLGDFAEVVTNGVFKGAVHRVVTNSEKDRISVVTFCTPEDSKEIESPSELVNDQWPQLYRKFTISEFKRKFFESYARGVNPLDAFKL